MRAIMVMFDTLNRHWLPPYGCDWIHAPNFQRLAEKTVVFDNCYVGSMPCMPARRELHTGRYNFLHRSWGPVEPFDDSMPELLKKQGVYTHLVTDHQHYWEDGGATYHTRYSSHEFIRGQEGDPWKGHVGEIEIEQQMAHDLQKPLFRQDQINREYFPRGREEDFPQAQTFSRGMEFIRKNSQEDRWFLQLETFDPHEPFYAPQKYRDLYPHEYNGRLFDWPPMGPVSETPEEIAHIRYEYAALLSMCDAHLGKVLDLMDELDMWKDTMLIVNTDHGFLLGEHDYWAKNAQPWYNEIAHTPLFIWDPRSGKKAERRSSLVQMIDMAPTLLDFFGLQVPKDMTGKPLRETVLSDQPVREAALFGIHGGHVNCTDGRYVYMRGPMSPDNGPLYEYTLMPTHMKNMYLPNELQNMELQEPFSFTKNCQTLKVPVGFQWFNVYRFGTKLFDVVNDPKQQHELDAPDVELRFIRIMAELMTASDSPPEQFVRLGIPVDGIMDESSLKQQKKEILANGKVHILKGIEWTREAQNQWHFLLSLIPAAHREMIQQGFVQFAENIGISQVNSQLISQFVDFAIPPENREMVKMILPTVTRTD
ncbi:sulfatase [Paenibacillus motobuensis]|uniref:Sulfatase n=1 Tax=Paenibacillus motobuensis TaxID=295324 RepID=A0ABP3IF18_9BACL